MFSLVVVGQLSAQVAIMPPEPVIITLSRNQEAVLYGILVVSNYGMGKIFNHTVLQSKNIGVVTKVASCVAALGIAATVSLVIETVFKCRCLLKACENSSIKKDNVPC